MKTLIAFLLGTTVAAGAVPAEAGHLSFKNMDPTRVIRHPDKIIPKPIRKPSVTLIRKTEREARRAGDRIDREAARGTKKGGESLTAAGHLTERTIRSRRDATLKGIKLASRGKILEAAYHVNVDPIKASDKNLYRATQESDLAMIAGRVVASANAGAAGGAAFEMWQAKHGGAGFEEILKRGALSAAGSYAFNATGDVYSGPLGSATAPDSTSAVLAHGIVGGGLSIAQGGDFRSGAMAAMFAKGASAFGPDVDGYAANVTRSAVVGGIGSRLAGGEFGEGAVTGAMSYAYNDAMHSKAGQRTLVAKCMDGLASCAAALPDIPQEASDFAQGLGSGASYTATDWVNEKLGTGGYVNRDSGYYQTASAAGLVIANAFYPAAALRGMAHLGSLGKTYPGLRWINNNPYLRFGYTPLRKGPFTYGSTYNGARGPTMRFTNNPQWWNHIDLRVLGK